MSRPAGWWSVERQEENQFLYKSARQCVASVRGASGGPHKVGTPMVLPPPHLACPCHMHSPLEKNCVVVSGCFTALRPGPIVDTCTFETILARQLSARHVTVTGI